MAHLTVLMGLPRDDRWRAAFWSAYERILGGDQGRILRAILLVRYEHGDVDDSEEARVCLGLQNTLPWMAEAVARESLRELGYTGRIPKS